MMHLGNQYIDILYTNHRFAILSQFKDQIYGARLGFKMLDSINTFHDFMYETNLYFYENFFVDMLWYEKLLKFVNFHFSSFSNKRFILASLISLFHVLIRKDYMFSKQDYYFNYENFFSFGEVSNKFSDIVLEMMLEQKFIVNRGGIFIFSDFEMRASLYYTSSIVGDELPLVDETGISRKNFNHNIYSYYNSLYSRVSGHKKDISDSCYSEVRKFIYSSEVDEFIYDFNYLRFDFKDLDPEVFVLLENFYVKKIKMNYKFYMLYFSLNFSSVNFLLKEGSIVKLKQKIETIHLL